MVESKCEALHVLEYGDKNLGQASSVGWLEVTNCLVGLKPALNFQAQPPWGKPTTCTIVNRQEVWYASFTVQCLPSRETGTGAVGLDFGCLTAASMSDGTMVENPRFLATMKARISKASKAKRRWEAELEILSQA